MSLSSLWWGAILAMSLSSLWRGVIPKGFELVAGDKRSAITGAPVIETHPERMPAVLCLASPSGCEGLLLLAGGVRCARPPATCCHPFRMKLFWGARLRNNCMLVLPFSRLRLSPSSDLGVIAERSRTQKMGSPVSWRAHVQVIQIGRLPNYLAGSTSKRSRFITLSHAATKSLTNFSLPSLLA